MILFLAKNDKNIENCKKKNINSYEELLDFYNKNGDNLKKFEQIIIDEDLIQDEKIILDFKEKFIKDITIYQNLEKENSIQDCEEKISAKNKLLEEFNKLDVKKTIPIDNINTYVEKTKTSLFENKKQKNLDKLNKSKEKQEHPQKKDDEKTQKYDEIKKEMLDEIAVEKVIHDKKEMVEKTNQLKELTQSYKNTSHIKKEQLEELENKNYASIIQNEEILNVKNYTEKEKTKNKIDFKFLNISKIPKMQSKKEKKQDITSKNNNTLLTQTNAQKGEIAITGGLQGVGTTYCAFKLASLYPNNLKIGYIQYKENEIEISILKEVKEQGYINDNITIYSSYEILSAYQENDIVIIDYGQFDISDRQLLIEFERASNKYIVVNSKFNKITSINKAITYSQQSNNFKTIFNMQDESELIKLQKKYRDLDIICFGYDSL